MLSALCVLLPTLLSNILVSLCDPASSTSVATAPALAVDGTQLSPLNVTSRWIVDTAGKRVKLRCVNWAGHLEPNVPEGLNKRQPEDLAAWIAGNGFNCVRLTYSIDMTMSPDTSVQDSFAAAANSTGATNLTAVYDAAVQMNPWLGGATTQGAFAYVISALGDKGIRVVLDNHVSKAGWCCNPFDGNGWWDAAAGYTDLTSKYFNTTQWLAGLRLMAEFSKRHPNVVAMSLRNELRAIGLQDMDNHKDWYGFTSLGAQQIHYGNPDLLVVFGGVNSATDLSYLYGTPLSKDEWSGQNKTIYEGHVYYWSYVNSGVCFIFNVTMGDEAGYLLEQNKAYTGPLWISEWGVDMSGGNNDGLSDVESAYLKCLVGYMEGNDAEWAIWALQGSYYVRSGQINYDETYGLLDNSWTSWRNPKFPAMLGSMWNVTQGP